MIEPQLHDESFLADIQLVRGVTGAMDIWWLGQSGYLIHWSKNFILIDPYLSDSLTTKYENSDKPHTRMSRRVVDPRALDFITLITSSHNHTDHLDPETLKPLIEVQKNFGGMIAPAANLDTVESRTAVYRDSYLRGLDDGLSVTTCRTRITGIAAAHETIERDAHGRCRYLGYVFQFGKWAVYHSGDTVLYDGIVEKLRPFNVDLALLPINGRAPERRVAGNLWGREAAWLAKEIGAKLVVPCHYDMFEFNTATPDEFVAECERLGQPYKVLRLGERLTLTGQGKE